jgi:Icc-related predicted phosphoesterase
MICVAAVGDIHFSSDLAGTLRPQLEALGERAGLFLLAGDLTKAGRAEEARALAAELAGVEVPMVAVLGNHDYHCGEDKMIGEILEGAGVNILEGTSIVVRLNGTSVGVAGTKGFGGGFAGACGTEFGEPEMKAFIGHTRMMAARLKDALASLDADHRIALLHYSPIKGTLRGERLEIYPFLGSYLLAEAVDSTGADLIVHGHSHGGTEKGVTPGGIHVRNVAQPVIKSVYNLYELSESSPPRPQPVAEYA